MTRKPSKSSLASAASDREAARAELAAVLAKRPIAELAALPMATWQRLGPSGLLALLGVLAQRGRPQHRFLDTRAVRRRLLSWRDRHAEQLFRLRLALTMVPSPVPGVIAGIAAGFLYLAVLIALG